MFQSGFLGTDADLISDLTLVAEILLFLAISVGVVAQRRRRYRLHDWIQTPVVVLNLLLIISVMVASFMEQEVASTLPRRPTDPYYLAVAAHALLGLITVTLAVYALLAGHKILARKIGRLRYWMWATYAFWAATVVAGVFTYYIWYVQAPPAVAQAPPESSAPPDTGIVQDSVPDSATKQVFLQGFAFAPSDLTITAGTEIVWLNQDGAPHNVTFVDGSAASENFFRDETYVMTFPEPGVYEIYCTLHGSPDGSGMAMTVTVLEDNPQNVAVVEAAPTPNPIPPTPTPVPTVPPPPVSLLQEEETPQQRVVGLVSFFDTNAPSDSISVLLNGIAAPQAGATFEAWLTDSQTNTVLPLGQAIPDENGNLALQFTDPDARNLLGLYDGFQLTQEPQFDDDPAPGTVVYDGQQVPQALSAIRTITVAGDDAPAAYGLGARYQTEELLRHAGYVQTAYDFLSIADAQRHAEHIVNLLEGAQGEHYGDLDGAHGVQDPGDGYGILPYASAMQDSALRAAGAPDATHAIQVHSGHVVLATDNALHWGSLIRDAALQILSTDSVGDIGPYVETIMQVSPLLLNGADDNGDGNVAPDEGGIFTAYQHAQYMAAVPVSGAQ